MLARWTPAGGQAWSLADKQGTVRDVTDAAGAVVGTRSYDAFGRILAESGVVDRFAFQGREWDAGAGLYQFRARWYDPVTRQFTSADPLGFAAGDANTRRFVANNPLSGTDPTGMTVVAEYAKQVKEGIRAGSAVAGYVFGAACGFVDGWFDTSVPEADRYRHALVRSAQGAAVGAVLGALLYPFGAYGIVITGTLLLGAAGVAQSIHAGQYKQAATRFLCAVIGTRRLPKFGTGTGTGGVPLRGGNSPLPSLKAVLSLAVGGGGGGRLLTAARPKVQSGPAQAAPPSLMAPGLLQVVPLHMLPVPGPKNMADPQGGPGVPDPGPQPGGPADPAPNLPQNQGGDGGGNDAPGLPATPPRSPAKGSDTYKPEPSMSSRPGKSHGWEWSDADAKRRALDTVNPQGRWGSKADADHAMSEARYLQPGESTVIDPLPGSKNVLFNPDGTVTPAPKVFILVRESGIVHAFPVEAGYVPR